MANTALISIICEDRAGLISAITARLFDLGVNLGDTTFAVLGSGAEFTTVCELPSDVPLETVEADMRGLPELKDAKLTVSPFSYESVHGPSAEITHRIEIHGEDSPGLVARLSEVFVEFGANIVRLNSSRVPAVGGAKYVLRLAVWIPEAKVETCLATVANTAGELKLTCRWAVV